MTPATGQAAAPARAVLSPPTRRPSPGPLVDPRAHRGSYARADLRPEPATAAVARRLTRDALARWDMQHLTDDAEAIASELAANAISAATPARGNLPAIIFATHRRPDELRIMVWDNGPSEPQRRAHGPDDETGRGLAIIDYLTGRNWGWWPTPCSGGKVVWAALPAPTPAPEARLCIATPAPDCRRRRPAPNSSASTFTSA
jgi:anti-sigma regulatory factor (Ser/Thr protein kinase)